MAASKIKASDRSKACQQIVTVLKKEYGSKLPSYNHDVLDTLLFSVCLENSNLADAESALQRLKESFFDYNELRVSSISEIQNSFVNMSEPEWRGMRARDIVQHVFESGYSFEVEDLKKKTMDSAEKQLKKVKSLTPFNIAYTLLFSLGSHVVPTDKNILRASIWLGLLEPGTKIKAAGEQFKAAVRKSDVPLFFHLMSQLACTPEIVKVIAATEGPTSDDPLKNLTAAQARLKDLLAGKIPIPRKPKASKPTKAATTKKADKPASKSTKSTASAKEEKTPPAKTPTKKKTVAPKATTATKKPTPVKKKTTKKSVKKKTTKKGK